MSADDMTFEDKVKVLRKIHSRSHIDAKQQISEWEDTMSRLQVEKEWLAHPTTMALRAIALNQIDAITSRLANDRNLTETAREALFEMKDVHYAYLAVLTSDPEAEMEEITKAVEFELSGN